MLTQTRFSHSKREISNDTWEWTCEDSYGDRVCLLRSCWDIPYAQFPQMIGRLSPSHSLMSWPIKFQQCCEVGVHNPVLEGHNPAGRFCPTQYWQKNLNAGVHLVGQKMQLGCCLLIKTLLNRFSRCLPGFIRCSRGFVFLYCHTEAHWLNRRTSLRDLQTGTESGNFCYSHNSTVDTGLDKGQ